jgi:hypothetical protein
MEDGFWNWVLGNYKIYVIHLIFVVGLLAVYLLIIIVAYLYCKIMYGMSFEKTILWDD